MSGLRVLAAGAEGIVRPRRLIGRFWVAPVGAGVSTAIGVATHKIAIGLAVGTALGAIVDVLILWARRS